VRGVYLSRPNRFEILVRSGNDILRAHCPNPGRMEEILLPDTPVILERAESLSRSTAYTFVAAVHHGEVVALHSTRTNSVAEALILPAIFKNAPVRREVTFGRSRFDFAVDTKNGMVLTEVKSCTLCEHGVAMFPDAPSSRGVKHIRELAELVRRGEIAGGVVLFVIGHPSPSVFAPNIHTDPEFSRVLSELQKLLTVKACSISVSLRGVVTVTEPDVPVEYRPVKLAEEDRGVYFIVLFLNTGRNIETGGLGVLHYPRGWYVYAGSAKRGLSARVRRHLRKRKKCRWHIDYLSLSADSVRGYPIHTDMDLECELAYRIGKTGGRPVTGFGSSDCSCETHLFHFVSDPFLSRSFVDLLFLFRHRRALENYLPGSICRRAR